MTYPLPQISFFSLLNGISKLLPLNLMIYKTSLWQFLGHFLAYDSHFSSSYIFFHYSTQQAFATSSTQLRSFCNPTWVPAYEAALCGAWESWKNDAPTMENTSMNYSDTHLQLIKCVVEETYM